MSPAPEIRSLLELVRAWLHPARAAAPPAVEAEPLARLARRQRVLPLLDDLERRGLVRLPEPLARAARREHGRVLVRNLLLLDAAERATAALHAAGVRVLRLKGAELSLTSYPSPGLRPMDDVDLLVPRASLAAALEALERAGFVPAAGLAPLPFWLRHHFHLPLVDPARRLPLELHWELLDRPARGRLGAAEAWADARPIDPARPALGERLAADVRLLHLALHLAKHAPFLALLAERVGAEALEHPASGAHLMWLVDLEIGSRDPGADPVRLGVLARAAGVEREAHASLRLARELLGSSAPPPSLRPAPAGAARRWFERLLGRLLVADLPASGRLLAWASRADRRLQVRPLRLLALPLAPGGLIAGLGRALELAAAWLRLRLLAGGRG